MPGPTVHFRYTVEWAMAEGLSRPDAEAVAGADASTDALWPGSKRFSRHFNPTAAFFWAPWYFVRAVRERSLKYLGHALHARQDAIGHGVFGMSHLRYRFGLIDRDPDDWGRMSARARTAIERRTRSMVRRYVRMTAPPRRAEPVSPPDT